MESAWKVELASKYPLVMGRYLTEDEREDIRRIVPDHGPDWSNWVPPKITRKGGREKWVKQKPD